MTDEAAAGAPRASSKHESGAGSDADAEFAAFYRQTVKRLVGFLIVQGATLADAAEVAQDTLCAAYRRWDSIDHPRAWVYRVASRGLIRRLTSVEDPVDEPTALTPLVRADIEHWEQQHHLVTVLASLPPRQRQVLAWTLYDHTPAEIANELGLTSEAVRSSLKKARRALAIRLAAMERGE
jgi:RNA polymerase sigma-70 factor (ECF subfamily)